MQIRMILKKGAEVPSDHTLVAESFNPAEIAEWVALQVLNPTRKVVRTVETLRTPSGGRHFRHVAVSSKLGARDLLVQPTLSQPTRFGKLFDEDEQAAMRVAKSRAKQG